MTLRTTIPTIEDELREEMNRVAVLLNDRAGLSKRPTPKEVAWQCELLDATRTLKNGSVAQKIRCMELLKLIF